MTLIDDKWNFNNDIIDLEKIDFTEFDQKIKCITNNVLHLLECNFFSNNSLDSNSSVSNQDNLKSLMEKNKELKTDIEANVEKLKQLQLQYEHFKEGKYFFKDIRFLKCSVQIIYILIFHSFDNILIIFTDQKLLSQEIKDTHEAFLMAKKYYKKYFKLYYTIEYEQDNTQKIIVQFFTESRKTTDNYSICLLRDMKTSSYKCKYIKI